MVTSAATIATLCAQVLKDSLPNFIDTIVIHLHDEYESVSSEAQKAISALSSSSLPLSVTQVLRENLYKTFTSLPRLARRANDVHTLMALRLVIGYICLLNQQLDSILNASLHHISLSLLQTLEFDLYDVRKLQDTPHALSLEKLEKIKVVSGVTNNNNDNATSTQSAAVVPRATGYPKKIFKYFMDEQAGKNVVTLCRLLGYYGDIMLLFDHFRSALQNKRHRKQSIFIINEIILGAEAIGLDDELKMEKKLTVDSKVQVVSPASIGVLNMQHKSKLTEDLVKMIIDEYLSSQLWDVPTSNRDSESQLTIEELNDNVLVVSMLLEGIGNIAQALGVLFENHLVNTLYVLLEKLGDDSAMVSQSAWATLQRIASSCNYASAAELISKNTDYVIDTICHHLSHLREYPKSPLVLKGMLQFTDTSILPLLEDTLQSLFHTIDEHSNSSTIITFFNILLNIVMVLNRNIKPKVHKSKEEKKEVNGEVEDQPKKPSLEHTFTLEILEKTQHFMGSRSREVRLLMLDIIQHGVPILGASEDSGLLPMIHTLWEPMMKRFVDKDAVVVKKSLEVCGTMIIHSDDFMTSRFVSDLWPILKNALSESTSKELTEKHSQRFKLQQSIFTFLTLVCRCLKLRETLRDIAETCSAFLSCKRPKEFQEATVELFKEMIKRDAKMVSECLDKIRNGSLPKLSAASGKRGVIVNITPRPQDYMDNCSLLLPLLIEQVKDSDKDEN